MDRKIDPRPAIVTAAYRWRAPVLRIAVGLVIGLLFVLAFIRLVDFHSVFPHLAHLSVGLALLSGAVFLSAYVVRALRWRLFLSPYQVSIRRVVAIYQVAIFINWLLPLRAGELAKCLMLRRLNAVPVSHSLPAVTMDKAMDLIPAVGLLAVLPFLPLHLSRPLWLLLLLMLWALAVGVLVLGLAAWRRHRVLNLLTWLTVTRLPGSLRNRVELFIARFLDALLALAARPRLLLAATAYTAVAVLLDALFCFLAFRAVGSHVAFPVVLYGFTFFNLAFILPTPPGQIGSNELIGLLVFSGMLRINRSAVAALFLFAHPWTALLMTISGILLLSAMGFTLRTAFALTETPAGADVTGSDSVAAVPPVGRHIEGRAAEQSPEARLV
jgi:uncharacterized protein (TIRG00374 family)